MHKRVGREDKRGRKSLSWDSAKPLRQKTTAVHAEPYKRYELYYRAQQAFAPTKELRWPWVASFATYHLMPSKSPSIPQHNKARAGKGMCPSIPRCSHKRQPRQTFLLTHQQQQQVNTFPRNHRVTRARSRLSRQTQRETKKRNKLDIFIFSPPSLVSAHEKQEARKLFAAPVNTPTATATTRAKGPRHHSGSTSKAEA